MNKSDSSKITGKWGIVIYTKGRRVLVLCEICLGTCCHHLNCSLQLHSRGTDLLHWCQLHFNHICSLLLHHTVHSLRNLFLLFLVQQISSDCLGLLLGLTLPLHPLSCQTGLMHLNGTAAENIFLVWICVKVFGKKVASGCLCVGNTMISIFFLDTWWFSAFSLHFVR